MILEGFLDRITQLDELAVTKLPQASSRTLERGWSHFYNYSCREAEKRGDIRQLNRFESFRKEKTAPKVIKHSKNQIYDGLHYFLESDERLKVDDFWIGRIYLQDLEEINSAIPFLTDFFDYYFRVVDEKTASEFLNLVKQLEPLDKLRNTPLYEKITEHLLNPVFEKVTAIGDIYLRASLLKRLSEETQAEVLFNVVLEECEEPYYVSGALFHLGELKFYQGDYQQASDYFLAVLAINPLHKKAKEYSERVKTETS